MQVTPIPQTSLRPGPPGNGIDALYWSIQTSCLLSLAAQFVTGFSLKYTKEDDRNGKSINK